MPIIIGLIMMIVGALVTIKSEAVYSFFGPMSWFEDKLATSGGSRFGYKIIGIIIFFLGVLTTTGLIGGFMEFVLSPLLKYSRQE